MEPEEYRNFDWSIFGHRIHLSGAGLEIIVRPFLADVEASESCTPKNGQTAGDTNKSEISYSDVLGLRQVCSRSLDKAD